MLEFCSLFYCGSFAWRCRKYSAPYRVLVYFHAKMKKDSDDSDDNDATDSNVNVDVKVW